MEYSSKWNTHQNGTLIKMEHSYQNGIHQNGTLIKNGTLISKRNSSKMELIK